jgi:hypothetical protein
VSTGSAWLSAVLQSKDAEIRLTVSLWL